MPEVNVRQEMERRKSQQLRILELIRDNQFVFTYDLEKIAYHYTARISELRKEGHIINAEYEKPGVYRYTYGGQKEVE